MITGPITDVDTQRYFSDAFKVAKHIQTKSTGPSPIPELQRKYGTEYSRFKIYYDTRFAKDLAAKKAERAAQSASLPIPTPSAPPYSAISTRSSPPETSSSSSLTDDEPVFTEEEKERLHPYALQFRYGPMSEEEILANGFNGDLTQYARLLSYIGYLEQCEDKYNTLQQSLAVREARIKESQAEYDDMIARSNVHITNLAELEKQRSALQQKIIHSERIIEQAKEQFIHESIAHCHEVTVHSTTPAQRAPTKKSLFRRMFG